MSNKSSTKTNNKNKKNKKNSVRGTNAFGTNRQGPLMLKSEQFATYTPLITFHVTQGSTPGGVRIRGRELLRTMRSGSPALSFGADGTNSAVPLSLNPNNFPRLGAYAPIYEMFIFHKFKIMFQSSQPTTVAGVSFLSVDYDSSDPVASTATQMMRNISSSMSNVYADSACEGAKTLSRLPRYFTNNVDTMQTVQATMLYAFEGVTAVNSTMGYLIVEYDVEFFTPQ